MVPLRTRSCATFYTYSAILNTRKNENKKSVMHMYFSSGVNVSEINEASAHYILSFNFHYTNLGSMFLKKQCVLNIW